MAIDIVDLIIVGFVSGIGSALGFVVVTELLIKRMLVKYLGGKK